jgi:hypothetical protein
MLYSIYYTAKQILTIAAHGPVADGFRQICKRLTQSLGCRTVVPSFRGPAHCRQPRPINCRHIHRSARSLGAVMCAICDASGWPNLGWACQSLKNPSAMQRVARRSIVERLWFLHSRRANSVRCVGDVVENRQFLRLVSGLAPATSLLRSKFRALRGQRSAQRLSRGHPSQTGKNVWRTKVATIAVQSSHFKIGEVLFHAYTYIYM